MINPDIPNGPTRVADEPCDAFARLACPMDGSRLTHDGDWLLSEGGRRYPIVMGVPVLLREDVHPTMVIARESLTWARRWAEGDRSDPFFIETLGISREQRHQVRARVASSSSEDTDVAVSYLVAATNGILYRRLIGRLERIPIPEIPMAPGSHTELLDVGCSWGRWSIAAASKGYRPIGIDPSLGAVLAAKRLARIQGLEFSGVVGDARHLPFQDGVIGAAFSYSVLQHFSREDVVSAFREIARVVAPGGPVRIQMASATGLRSLQHMARRGFRVPMGFEVRYWSPFSLMRAFSAIFDDAGLEVDCYFGLGLQLTDRSLYGRSGRIALSASETLRKAARRLVPLRYLADSVYLIGNRSRRAVV